MGPEMVKQWEEDIHALEADKDVRVVVSDSAVEEYFRNHAGFNARLKDLTALPAGPTACRPGVNGLFYMAHCPLALSSAVSFEPLECESRA